MYTRQVGGIKKVALKDGEAKLHVHLVGPHPILLFFFDKMNFISIVNSCLTRVREGWLDHAQALSVLVQNILLSPAPLYRIAEWAEPISPESLGLTEKEKESINDDRVARALDALTSARGRSLFFHLAIHTIEQFELETRRIHNDTTTVTFQGRYESSFRQPRITRGINKDHRPDLKQLVFGLNVTADGAVPISHEIYSGNRNDDTIHRGNIERLRQILGHEEFIYVADGKLCSYKNLAYIKSYGGKFVTVMPRTWAEDKRFRKMLREGRKVRWRCTLVIENKRRQSGPPDIFWTTNDAIPCTKHGDRLIWCKSSQKAEVDALIREVELRKAEAELFDLGTRLNKGKLTLRHQIKEALDIILEEKKCKTFLDVKILTRTVIRTKRLHPGRPKPGDPVRQEHTNAYQLIVSRNKKALRAEARTDGVFPLITNIEKTARKQVLLIYKYQPYVEKRHALFKTELGVAPVYLKKPLRAAGLIHATFLAMIVDALIERTVRLAMEREGIEQLPILPEGRLTKTPTTARILEMFSNVAWYEFEKGKEKVAFPVELSPLQKELLRLLGMDASAYA
jgi:transposase